MDEPGRHCAERSQPQVLKLHLLKVPKPQTHRRQVMAPESRKRAGQPVPHRMRLLVTSEALERILTQRNGNDLM